MVCAGLMNSARVSKTTADHRVPKSWIQFLATVPGECGWVHTCVSILLLSRPQLILEKKLDGTLKTSCILRSAFPGISTEVVWNPSQDIFSSHSQTLFKVQELGHKSSTKACCWHGVQNWIPPDCVSSVALPGSESETRSHTKSHKHSVFISPKIFSYPVHIICGRGKKDTPGPCILNQGVL